MQHTAGASFGGVALRGAAVSLTASRRSYTDTASTVPPAPSGSHGMALEFRRFCDEQMATVAQGVPTTAFSAHIGRSRQLSLAAAEALIRGSGCFVYEGTRVLLVEAARQDVADFTPAMGEIARRLPAAGVGATRMKELLAELAPTFSPAAIGTYTLRDALQMFPSVFVMEPAAKGKWLVKPAVPNSQQPVARRPPASTAASDQRTSTVRVLDFVARQCAAASSAGGQPQISLNAVAESLALPRQAVATAVQDLRAVLDVSVEVSIRPKLRSRGCIALVDGDGVSASDAARIFRALGYEPRRCSVTVVRHGASHAHTAEDVVVDERVPAYMALEHQAQLVRASTRVVLQNVVLLCAPETFAMYRDRVAWAVDFPDAMVFVASVGAVAKVK